MRPNEQPLPTPEQIAKMTAEIRRNWTPDEERKRRVVIEDRCVPVVVVPAGILGAWDDSAMMVAG